MMDAIAYEIERQVGLLESGEEVAQETRLFDESKRITLPMRSKEDAPDYRYFPDPDLVEIEIDEDFIHEIKNAMPELPDQKVDRIVESYAIPRKDALVLTKDRHVSDYFESSASRCDDSRKLSAWMIKDLFRLLNEASLSIIESPVSPEDFAQLVSLMSQEEITEKIGRTVLEGMFATGKKPDVIIEEKGLRPIQDADVLEKILLEILEKHPDVEAQIKSGQTKPIDFLIGQVMRRTDGKANAKIVRDIILRLHSS
jgi:aspartyl-tRNA(Asn)/glutamyl-tRNA(Gln) amidotransferase subunit B